MSDRDGREADVQRGKGNRPSASVEFNVRSLLASRLELQRVRRTSGEFSSNLGEVNIVPFLKSALTDRMLLPMVVFAKADRPAIGRLQTESAISPDAHVSAFDRHSLAAGYGAVMLPDPRPVRRAASRRAYFGLARNVAGQNKPRHRHAPRAVWTSPQPWLSLIWSAAAWLGHAKLLAVQ